MKTRGQRKISLAKMRESQKWQKYCNKNTLTLWVSVDGAKMYNPEAINIAKLAGYKIRR